MREDTTLSVFGAQGNSVAQNTAVATLPITTPGRYRIWGLFRHTLADGLKFTSPIALSLTSGPNDTVVFGPLVVDFVAAGNIIVALATATGASDTASATIFAEKINH